MKTSVCIAPVIEGCLTMRGLGLIHKPWANKYIEFYGLHKVIIYYKCNNNNEKGERRGSLKLVKMEVISIDNNDINDNNDNNDRKRYVFRVVVNKIKANGTLSSFRSELLLQALTETEMNKWIYILNVYTCSSRSSFLIDTLNTSSSLLSPSSSSSSSSSSYNATYQYISSGLNSLIENIFNNNDSNMIKLAMIFSNVITLFTTSIQIKKEMCKLIGSCIYNIAIILLDQDIYPLYNNISSSYIRKLKISLIETENHFRRLAELGFLTVIIEDSDESSDFYLYYSAIENLANDLCIAINHQVIENVININANTVDDKLINQAKRIMISEDSVDAISANDHLIKEFADMIDCDEQTVRIEVNFVSKKHKEIFSR